MANQHEEEKSFEAEIQEELSLGPELKPETKGSEFTATQTDATSGYSTRQQMALSILTMLKEKGLGLYSLGYTKACKGLSDVKTMWATGDRKKLVIMGVALIVLLVSVFTWALSGGEHKGFHKGTKAQQVQTLAKALYYPLSRPLVVRFDDRGVFSLIRVKLSLLVREEQTLAALTNLDASLKESFVMVLAKGNSDKLLTPEGKDELLKNFLDLANKAVQHDPTRAKKNVDAVLLQEFMMQ